jgi:hypothetical protein
MKFQIQESIKGYTRNQLSCKHLIFLAIFLFFVSCGSPESPIIENKDCSNMEVLEDLSNIEINSDSKLFSERISFIYKGDNKIQCLEDGIIKDEDVAILRGKECQLNYL